MKEHIEEAIQKFRLSATGYARSERYYRGDHDLAFATEKFANTFGSLFREFALNLCPAVCDAVRDKLRITQFLTGSDDADLDTARIWQQNRMPIRAGEVHREALVCGDAYVIVWPDANGRPAIYPNRASACTVIYDEENGGTILRAAKYWRTHDRHTRLNIFYPDRIERFVTAKPGEGILTEADAFVRYRDAVPNPYGVVPVFHFANNADIGAFGRSEIEAAIPVQDGMNKAVLDMLVAMEFSAYRQRWAAGIEIEYDNEGQPVAPFKAGVDHLWLAQNPDARFGDFNTADLDQFLKVKDSFRVDIASVTGTPMYYLLPNSRSFPSGEALRKAETRFIAKVRERQAVFGQTWADVMAFALHIAGHKDVFPTTRWEDPARLSEREELENILLRKQIGISDEQALREAGYTL
ncbi:MAG: phage portal protein [Acidobacteria bacterium]|nr:phage portal protein [Acidobacteriota bacterium]